MQPERAAAEPTMPEDLYRMLAHSAVVPVAAVQGGIAHAFWADGREINDSADIFTAAIPQ